MFGWFFRKGGASGSATVDSSLQKSFANIRSDMAQISEWISHFKQRHDVAEQKIHEHAKKHVQHESRLEDALARLALLEQRLSEVDNKGSDEVHAKDTSGDDAVSFYYSDRKVLPTSQERVCFILANLQQREQDKWFPLSRIAQEMYPGREYRDTRSAILQLINVLEVEGYILKKKVNRTVYVLLKKEKISEFVKDISLAKSRAKQKK